ncbi:MAG: hypothetical protein IT285_03830 [Bdellovibrionales bacterium]|nr:hypothetical protein [Bdellovibrionales bacterium]
MAFLREEAREPKSMSSINPSQQYSQYARSLGELEAELREQAAKSREGNEERVKDLEERYGESLRGEKEEYEETVGEIRDQYTDRLETQKNDYETQLREGNYNRRGRMAGGDAETVELRQEKDQLARALELERRQSEEKLEGLQKAHERQLVKQAETHEREQTQTVDSARQNANESIHRMTASGRDQYQENLDRIQEGHASVAHDLRAQLDEERQRSKWAVEDISDQANHRLALEAKANSRGEERREFANSRDREREANAMRDSHRDESDFLRSQLEVLAEKDRDFGRGKAEGRAFAIAEVEQEWVDKMEAQTRAHDHEIYKGERDAADAERHLSASNAKRLGEAELQFTRTLQRQNQESQDRVTDLQRNFERAKEQVELRSEKDLASAQISAARRLDRANEARDASLSAQATTYKELMARQGEEARSRESVLKKQVNELKTSEDSSLVSPSAANAIHRQVAGGYQKSLEAETARNRRAVEQMRDTYQDRHESLLTSSRVEKTKMANEHASSVSAERAVFMDHIYDTETSKEDAIKSSRLDHDSELDKMKRAQARILAEQRRRYEDILEAANQGSSTRIAAVRQEAEFNAKVSQRQYNQRMTEVIRQFGKQLESQKDEFQLEIAGVKDEANRALLEAQRQHRTDMEAQSRDYEQRLAQAEMTSQEKQRSLAQNYEEQLDSMKAANARTARQKA